MTVSNVSCRVSISARSSSCLARSMSTLFTSRTAFSAFISRSISVAQLSKSRTLELNLDENEAIIQHGVRVYKGQSGDSILVGLKCVCVIYNNNNNNNNIEYFIF